MFRIIFRSSVCLGINRNQQLLPLVSGHTLKSLVRKFGKSLKFGSSCGSKNLGSSSSTDLLKIMKLFTDKGNPFTLKVLSACNVSNVKMQLEIVNKQSWENPSFKKDQLPLLEVAPGQYLFDPNAMCSFIMDKNEESNNPTFELQQNEIIEWDATFLQPTLLPFLVSQASSNNKESALPENICKALASLNEQLTKSPYLAGSSLSLADVVIWGTVFGVLHGREKTKDIMAKYGSLFTWFTKLSSEPAFAKAITTVTEGQGVDTFKDALRGYSLPPICSKLASCSMENEAPRRESSVDTGGDEAVEGPSETEIASAKTAWLAGRTGIKKPRSYDPPVLPRENEKNYLITSALPYVNNVPHLGNIIGCVLSGDVYARYCRLRNYNVLYICGTDEYGTATETKAIEEGMTPQQICDKYHKIHAEIYEWFNIQFDYFGRTTTEQQTEIAQDIFWKIDKNSFLKKDSLDQLQCIPCKRFLADRFVEGICPFCSYEDARGDQCDACGKLINAIELKSPRCKMCGSRPEIRTSNHIFLDLPLIEPQLKEWIDNAIEKGNWSANSRQITKGWLQEGLKPRCITRDLKWGTAVPMEGYEDKVFYVWFDAPIGYISITANYTNDWEKWWKNPDQVQLVQFMAKDNVPFHTVVFPCSLIGADDNYTLLNDINATEYLNYEDDKFSKSRGVGVFGDNAKDTGIPADIFRFYLLYLRPENQDSAFSWADLVLKNNSELLNNLGNFINRALMFLKNSFNSQLQEISLNEDDCVFIASVNRELNSYIENLEKIRLRDGLRVILGISKIGNQYMQANKPWVLVKGTEQEKARAGSIISLACNLSGLLAVLVKPYMPNISKEIQDQLALPAENMVMVDVFVPMLPAGHKIGNPSPLFQKIEASYAEKMKAKFAGKRKDNVQANPDEKKDDKTSVPQKENVKPTDIISLEEEIAKQGDIVRKAKMEQAGKDVINKEVEKLLALKKSLALVQGLDPEEATQSGKKKKGKKK